jgi:hypothetical protein
MKYAGSCKNVFNMQKLPPQESVSLFDSAEFCNSWISLAPLLVLLHRGSVMDACCQVEMNNAASYTIFTRRIPTARKLGETAIFDFDFLMHSVYDIGNSKRKIMF